MDTNDDKEKKASNSLNVDEKVTETPQKVAFTKSSGHQRQRRKRAREEDNESEDEKKETNPVGPAQLKKSFVSNSTIQSTKDVKMNEDDRKLSYLFSYSSDGSAAIANKEMYVSSLTDVDPEKKNASEGVIRDALGKEGMYKGKAGYSSYFQHTDKSMQIKGLGINTGPVRATSGIRVISYFDYNPEICKDYKETGYCGFGDNCKYIHDRGDYKSGWQLEQEWEEQQKTKEREAFGSEDALRSKPKKSEFAEEEEEVGVEESDEYPFACLKCRRPWSLQLLPVVTKCQHYFCETCARSAYGGKKCFECKEPTGGVFNVPKKLVAKIKKACE